MGVQRLAKALLFPGIDSLRETQVINNINQLTFITLHKRGALSQHGGLQKSPVYESYKEII